MTPYRSARVEGRALDPSRPKFGLAGAAVGAVACFASLMDLHFSGGFGAVDAVLLFGGSAAMAIMLVYSALDAPAGRVATLAAIALFGFSFVPQLVVREWMGNWVWSARYLGVGGIAGGLLLRLRRTRPGSYGALLRLAAIIGTWWGVQGAIGLAWAHTHQSVRSELLSRVVYLFLAAGMLDMRRFVGGVPMREPVRMPMHAAREIATTRLCLALVSIGATLSAMTYAWHSEWNVIASAEVVAVVVTVAFHLPWIARERGIGLALVAASMSGLGLTILWRAYAVSPLASIAAIFLAGAAIVVDLSVERYAAASPDPDARSTRVLAASAAALHAAWIVTALARLSESHGAGGSFHT